MCFLQPVAAESGAMRRAAGGRRGLRRLFPAVGEEDLHAWLDGELPLSRRILVRAFLWLRPAEARRLAAYRADGEVIASLPASKR
jgi:hypothetical protein